MQAGIETRAFVGVWVVCVALLLAGWANAAEQEPVKPRCHITALADGTTLIVCRTVIVRGGK